MCMEGECGRRQRRGKGIRRSEDMGVVMTRIMEWEEGPCRGIDILSWILAKKSANSEYGYRYDPNTKKSTGQRTNCRGVPVRKTKENTHRHQKGVLVGRRVNEGAGE